MTGLLFSLLTSDLLDNDSGNNDMTIYNVLKNSLVHECIWFWSTL